jgi:tubulin-specific chaperone E
MSQNITATQIQQLRIGRRYLHVASLEPCTLRFIGHLPSTSDESTTWLGVEWDNPSRGKHSGTHQGIQYFETEQEGAGSFIKVPDARSLKGKEKELLRPGPKLWDAILDRYLPEEEQDGQLLTLGSSNGAIKVEMPRLGRIKLGLADLKRLKEIGLERRWVSELGRAPDDISLECEPIASKVIL